MTSVIDNPILNIDDFDKPENFINKIHTLKEQVPSILDDFKKYYVFYNKNPDYPEYSQMFENIKSNLNNVNSNLFIFSNDVDVNTENISKKMFELNVLIKREREINHKLKHKLGILDEQINSTDEMINDYSKVYDEKYLQNWALFLSIIICGYAISVTYKK